MSVIYPLPSLKVCDYVERILVIDRYKVTTPFPLPLFANGTPTLLYLSTTASLKHKATSNLTLFGQTVFPETLTIHEDFTLIAYFLKPFSLYSLFGVSAQELTDFPIALNLLDPSQTDEIKEKLLEAGTTTEMLAILDDYIFRLITKSKSENEVLKYATSVLSKNASKENLVKVQKELFVSERTFERLFVKNIGVPPNLYRRICQFNAAFQQLNTGRFKKLSDLAFDNGYADQSHLIRAFREFGNITPREYLKFGRRSER